MDTFVRNNIRYRANCAKALEGYYQAKAFQLNEVINDLHQISETPKEILLLMFNTHNKALSFVESLLLGKTIVTSEDVEAIGKEIDNEHNIIVKVFDANQDVFDPRFIEHFNHVHGQLLFFLHKMVSHMLNMDPMLGFSYFVQGVIDYLNATLLELYELDCLLGSNIVDNPITTNLSNADQLVLYLDGTTQWYAKEFNVLAEVERFDYYVKALNLSRPFAVRLCDYISKRDTLDGSNKYVILVEQDILTRTVAKDVVIINKVD